MYYIGIDVGTGSARAALLDTSGTILAEAVQPTLTFRLDSDASIFEQSTANIWASIVHCVRSVVANAKVHPEEVKGLGFDATCSLAVVDAEGIPVEVTPGSNFEKGKERNIVLWADHRAEEQAKLINSTGHLVLNYVGRTMSLEMEIPKILWLKSHMPAEVFSSCQFFDLPDYLTYRATGSQARSNCSLVCKCSYVPPGVDGTVDGWQASFFEEIGLPDLAQDGFKQLGGIPGKGGVVLTAGQPVGEGLSPQAAEELGLAPGTPVGSGLIDAYAGWVGTVAARATNAQESSDSAPASLLTSQHRLAAIAGTSTCHVVQSPNGILVDGVWGPYKNAVFPGMWMNEGGQSSTGQLLDFVIDTHPAVTQAREMAAAAGVSLFELLHSTLDSLQQAQKLLSPSHLTLDTMVYPDFHGNRSPLADPTMRGLISGLKLDRSVSDLAIKYYATLEAIALQTRHIVEEMNSKGHQVRAIYMSGGHVKNATFMQLLADVTQLPIQLPFSSSASVVAGSAILGRFAAEMAAKGVRIESQEAAEKAAEENKERLWELMTEMTKPGTLLFPSTDARLKTLFDAKYAVFRDAIVVQRKWRKLVTEAAVASK